MSKFKKEHLKDISEGIKLYNQGKFWECHEELEDPWMEDAHDNVRYIYWAIIQIATALYHMEGENLIGATGMWKKAKHKLDKCEEYGVETPFLYQHLDWDHFKKLVRAIPDNPQLKDFNELHTFKFKKVKK